MGSKCKSPRNGGNNSSNGAGAQKIICNNCGKAAECRSNKQNQSSGNQTWGQNNNNDQRFCTHCNKNNHWTADCRKSGNQNNGQNGDPTCTFAGCKPNHAASKCTNKQNPNRMGINNGQNQGQSQGSKQPSRPCKHCNGSLGTHYDKECPSHNQTQGQQPVYPAQYQRQYQPQYQSASHGFGAPPTWPTNTVNNIPQCQHCFQYGHTMPFCPSRAQTTYPILPSLPIHTNPSSGSPLVYTQNPVLHTIPPHPFARRPSNPFLPMPPTGDVIHEDEFEECETLPRDNRQQVWNPYQRGLRWVQGDPYEEHGFRMPEAGEVDRDGDVWMGL